MLLRWHLDIETACWCVRLWVQEMSGVHKSAEGCAGGCAGGCGVWLALKPWLPHAADNRLADKGCLVPLAPPGQHASFLAPWCWLVLIPSHVICMWSIVLGLNCLGTGNLVPVVGNLSVMSLVPFPVGLYIEPCYMPPVPFPVGLYIEPCYVPPVPFPLGLYIEPCYMPPVPFPLGLYIEPCYMPPVPFPLGLYIEPCYMPPVPFPLG